MPDVSELTDLQLMILGVFWQQREATIGDVHDALRARTAVSRKTIATLLSRLERRGLVRHRMDGREGVYKATVTRRAVLASRMAGVLGALFELGPRGAGAAGARALDASEVQPGDVARLRALLRRAERDLQHGE
ncbi:MAG: BlaI/MecI/CopY family transcriptional regulator [Gemmatimonadota bacterium]|nr:BlaI/MecI/CopY family transcriptional regulator [Gemmatimonadota bacterium]